MRFLSSLFLLGFTVLAGSALATEPASLTVRVVDPQRAVVDEARVYVVHRDGLWRLEARAAGSGHYRFATLPAGRYLLVAEASGFARSGATILSLTGGESREIEVSLSLAPFAESVVVTSSDAAERRRDLTRSLDVVDGEEIESRAEIFVTEAVRTVPGIRVQTLGGPGSFAAIKTRGLRTEDTAVLVDGARLRDAAAPQGDASPFLEALTVGSVDRVEILRGTGSSLYGTNAGGGVINIVTASGGGEPSASVLVEGGGLGLFRAGATTTGQIGERALYSLGLSHLDVSKGVDGDDDARNTGFQGRTLFRLTPDAGLSVRVLGSDVRLGLNESPFVVGAPPAGVVEASPIAQAELARHENGAPVEALNLGQASFVPSANDPDNVRDSLFVSTLLDFDHRPSELFGYQVRYHGLFTERSFEDGPLGVSAFEPAGRAVSEFNGSIHTLSARGDVAAGSAQSIRFGYEVERERLENPSAPAGGAAGSATEVTQSSQSIFVQDRLTLLDGALAVTGAIRGQTFSLNDPTFTPAENAPFQNVAFGSPDGTVTLDLSGGYGVERTGTHLRAHFGTGYRAPSLFERFGASFSSFGYTVFGDPRLAPERTRTLDVGVDQSFLSDLAETSLTYFRTRLSEIIIFDFSGAISPETDPFGRFGGYRSTDGGITQGVEVTGSAALGRSLRLRGSYTFTDAEPPTGVAPDQDRAFVVPRHHFALVATRSFGDRLTLSFDLSAISSYLAPVFDPGTFTSRVFRFDGYVKSDLVVSYRFPAGGSHLRVFGKVDNLFDEEIFESGFRTPGRWAVAGVGVEF